MSEPTEAEWLEGNDPMTERERMESAMTTDNRMNEPTPEQVEAAAGALHETRNPWFGAYGDRGAAGFEIKKAFRESARAALVAAQGAAPQADSDDSPTPGNRLSPEFRADIVEAARDRIQAVWADVPEGVDALTLAQNIVSTQEFFWLSLNFPVLPSSTESPVEPFKTWFACWWKNEPNAIAESNAQSAFYAGWDARGLPSSGVDVDALAEVIGKVTDLWDEPLDEVHDIPQIARAVAEWLHSNPTKSA